MHTVNVTHLAPWSSECDAVSEFWTAEPEKPIIEFWLSDAIGMFLPFSESEFHLIIAWEDMCRCIP